MDVVRVLLVGPEAQGKSCLIRSIAAGQFAEAPPTPRDSTGSRVLEPAQRTVVGLDVDGEPVRVVLLEPAHAPAPRPYSAAETITSDQYDACSVIFMCYAVDSHRGLRDIEMEAQTGAGYLYYLTHSVQTKPLLLVGLKADLRDVPFLEGEDADTDRRVPISFVERVAILLHAVDVGNFEVSAKTGYQVTALLVEAVRVAREERTVAGQVDRSQPDPAIRALSNRMFEDEPEVLQEEVIEVEHEAGLVSTEVRPIDPLGEDSAPSSAQQGVGLWSYCSVL